MSEEQKEQAVDIFGLDAEFSGLNALPDVMTPVEEEEAPQLLSKEIDLGGNKVTVQGKDYDELITNITAKQSDFYNQQKSVEPEQDTFLQLLPKNYEPLPPPTADQLAQIMLEFPRDPVSAHKKLAEIAEGKPWAQIQEERATAQHVRQYIYGQYISNNFISRHVKFDEEGYVIGGDFYPCPENARAIRLHMEAKGYPETPANMDLAFSELKAMNRIKDWPPGYFDEPEEEQETPVATGLSGRDSSYVPGSGALSVEDIKRKAMEVPIEELEKAIKSGRILS